MIASFHSILFDLSGVVSFEAGKGTKLINYERRQTRTATLDGNSDISDMGYSVGDASITLAPTKPTIAQIETLIYLVKTYPLINYTDRTGSYEGGLSLPSDPFKKPLKIKFLPTRVLS